MSRPRWFHGDRYARECAAYDQRRREEIERLSTVWIFTIDNRPSGAHAPHSPPGVVGTVIDGVFARAPDWEQAARECLNRAVNDPGYNTVIDLDEPRPDRDGLGMPTRFRGPVSPPADVFGLGPFIPIVSDPTMPPDTFEVRSGDQVQRVNVHAEPLATVIDAVNALATRLYERTGRHGISRISLTPEVGLMLGIVPGTSMDVNTTVGRVEVYAERAARSEGTFTLDEDRSKR